MKQQTEENIYSGEANASLGSHIYLFVLTFFFVGWLAGLYNID